MNHPETLPVFGLWKEPNSVPPSQRGSTSSGGGGGGIILFFFCSFGFCMISQERLNEPSCNFYKCLDISLWREPNYFLPSQRGSTSSGMGVRWGFDRPPFLKFIFSLRFKYFWHKGQVWGRGVSLAFNFKWYNEIPPRF